MFVLFLRPLGAPVVFLIAMAALEPHFPSVVHKSPPDEEHTHDVGKLWLDFEQELRGFVRPKVESTEACEDLLQTAFVRAKQAVENGTEPGKPRAWLYQIIRNLLVDVYRSQKRDGAILSALRHQESVHRPELTSPERESADILAHALPAFVKTLPERYREALELTDLKGLGQAEAAQKVGVSLSCMKARVRRGREQLLSSLKKCCTFEIDRRGRPIACSPRASDVSCECD